MDKPLREFYKQIPSPMFDFHDYYRRLAESLPDNCVIAELGVAIGSSIIYLAETLANIGKPIGKIVLVDNLDYNGMNQMNYVIKNVHVAGFMDVVDFQFCNSLDAAKNFKDETFDFVFVDTNHLYQNTCDEIRTWYPKVRIGGILAGHDYNDHHGTGVEAAVKDTFLPDHVKIIATAKNFGIWHLTKEKESQIRMYDEALD